MVTRLKQASVVGKSAAEAKLSSCRKVKKGTSTTKRLQARYVYLVQVTTTDYHPVREGF